MKLGQKLKVIRKLKGATLIECAKCIGHASHVSILFKESGKNEISTTEIQQIAAFFQVPPEIFFYDEPGFVGYLYGSFGPAEVDRILEQVLQKEAATV